MNEEIEITKKENILVKAKNKVKAGANGFKEKHPKIVSGVTTAVKVGVGIAGGFLAKGVYDTIKGASVEAGAEVEPEFEPDEEAPFEETEAE